MLDSLGMPLGASASESLVSQRRVESAEHPLPTFAELYSHPSCYRSTAGKAALFQESILDEIYIIF